MKSLVFCCFFFPRQVELLSQELWTVKSEREMQVRSLEKEVEDLEQRLQGYEKIEKELDDIVMQSAEGEEVRAGERVHILWWLLCFS